MEQRETFFSLWSRRVMEACWLLALTIIPVYFSLLSDRHFEPDKATVLRSLALILGAAWIINILERGQVFRQWPQWRAWLRTPLIIPTFVYIAVFILTTLTSVLVWTSFWGGYNRLQGLFTNLAYIIIFGAVVANVRRRDQLERIISVIVATALPVLGYGLVQNQAIDPLPWAGDTATRIASTMGNSIFVAAYLILVLPFMLYRVAGSVLEFFQRPAIAYADRNTETSAETEAVPATQPALDLAWLLALGLLAVGQVATLYGILKLGALLQAPLIGFDHWWIFPGAVIATGSSLILFAYRTTSSAREDWRLYLPGVLLLVFLLLLLAGGYLTAPPCGDTVASDACLNLRLSTASRAENYDTWLLAGIGAYFVAFAMIVGLPRRRSDTPSKLMSGVSLGAFTALSLLTVIVIFFTQSRGPQIGMFVSVFTFITLLLIQAWRTYRKRLFLGLISGWMILSILGATFLVILNTTDSFAGLRENPYIARLGNLLETEGGTGRVRVLIWRGDDITEGAVGLVTANPVRTMLGWGPESMFVAYNPFYPPELATLESRGASPDRSHQAMLDELVTKGALGLFSYLFLYGSFAILMLRLLQVRRLVNLFLTTLFMLAIAAFFTIFLESVILGAIALVSGLVAIGLAAWLGYAEPLNRPLHFGWQLLLIACISAVVANFVENIFGIPIVSSLLYTWVVMGLGVVAGSFAGAYSLGQAAPMIEPEPEVIEDAQPTQKGKKARPQTRGARARSRARTASAPWRGVYPLLILFGLLGSWFLNLDGIYADMRFLQAKQWIDQGGTIDRHLLGYAALQDAIAAAPHEDLYYLTYGRALMTLATDVSQLQNQTLRENPNPTLAAVSNRRPGPDAQLEDLPEVEYSSAGIQQAVQTFGTQYGPLELLNYARLALKHAQQLNPSNKDHPANLGRLEASWFRNLEIAAPEEAQQHLDEAIKNYETAVAIAPQDVELAGQWAMLYTYRQEYDRALEILDRLLELDPGYANTLARKAEIKRLQNDLQATAELYGQAFANNPRVLTALLDVAELPAEREQRIAATLEAMRSDPQLLEAFLAGFPQAIERRPNDWGFRQTYVEVLSNTLQYEQALRVAREAQQQAQQQSNDRMNDVFTNFIRFFETRVSS